LEFAAFLEVREDGWGFEMTPEKCFDILIIRVGWMFEVIVRDVSRGKSVLQ